MYKEIITTIRVSHLSEDEMTIILAMGNNPDAPINLEHVNYDGINTSLLELTKMMHDLSSKGLVSLNLFSRSLISLTDAGRQKALKIKRELTNNKT